MADPLRDLELNVRSHLAFLELRARAAARAPRSCTRPPARCTAGPRYLPVDEDHATTPGRRERRRQARRRAAPPHLRRRARHADRAPCDSPTSTGRASASRATASASSPSSCAGPSTGRRIQVYGDGRQLRDCLHVDDVVRALALAAPRPTPTGNVFNLGHDDAVELGAIARLVVDAAGGASELASVPWPADHAAHRHRQLPTATSRRPSACSAGNPRSTSPPASRDTVAFYRAHPWYLSST